MITPLAGAIRPANRLVTMPSDSRIGRFPARTATEKTGRGDGAGQLATISSESHRHQAPE
jgi:hypothetical protein